MKKVKDSVLVLSDLSKSQLVETNGGWIATLIAIAGAFIYVYNNSDDFIEGFKDGAKNGL